MKHSHLITFLGVVGLFLLFTLAAPLYAQDGGEPNPFEDGELTSTDVFVTVQRNANLREGPGMRWDIITVIPYGETMRAVGYISGWVQVLYQEPTESTPAAFGWINISLLAWSGDLYSLPLDGVNPLPYIRVERLSIGLTENMLIYTNTAFGIGPRVTGAPPCESGELVGRAGEGRVIWLKFWCNGAYYWVGSYYFTEDATRSRYIYLPIAFRYDYGFLTGTLRVRLSYLNATLDQIESLWLRLQRGEGVSCNFIPTNEAPLDLSPEQVAGQPQFQTAVDAVETSIAETNAAIDLLRDACAVQDSEPFVPSETVDLALEHVGLARDALFFAEQLFLPLANRDPLTGGAG